MHLINLQKTDEMIMNSFDWFDVNVEEGESMVPIWCQLIFPYWIKLQIQWNADDL